MLPAWAGDLCGAGRAPGRRRRKGTRAIGFGVAGVAMGRAALRAGFLAFAPMPLMPARAIGVRLRAVGRLPLPDPFVGFLPAFFFAMARSCCLPRCTHFHM